MTIPVGAIISYIGLQLNKVEEEDGWLNCDGRSLSTDTYGDLYEKIGDSFGSSGRGYFNLPDLRGMFLRGVDRSGVEDPDFNARTSPERGNNETVPKGTVGSRQADQFMSHEHTLSKLNYMGEPTPWRISGGGSDWVDPAPPTDSTGGNETRPRNVYVYYLIYVG